MGDRSVSRRTLHDVTLPSPPAGNGRDPADDVQLDVQRTLAKLVAAVEHLDRRLGVDHERQRRELEEHERKLGRHEIEIEVVVDSLRVLDTKMRALSHDVTELIKSHKAHARTMEQVKDLLTQHLTRDA